MNKPLSILACLACAFLSAQQPIVKSDLKNVPVKDAQHASTGFEFIQTSPVKQQKSAVSAAHDIIGNTIYDLQSNASVDDRIHYDPNSGMVTGVWTMSNVLGFADRGTGYNTGTPGQWNTLPAARIENERTGWPSLVVTDTSEFVVSHGASYLVGTIRATKGTGAWTSSQMSFITNGALWPRATVGGPNNKTVHVVAITAPVANGGTVQKGLNGALIYYRSLDGGFTWDIQDSILPGQDSTLHFGFSGDSYAIDANGSTVAIAAFNDYDDSFILKSTDNGSTWSKTVFLDNPLDDYSTAAAGSISDINNDQVADTITSTDNTGSVLVDNNGLVHVTYGRMRYRDDDPVLDAPGSYFPATNGLDYWNENSTAPVTIAAALDLDNDGALNLSSITEIPLYYISLSGQPSMGVDANNNLFCVYSGFNELEFNGVQFYRKLYRISSRDGGATWNTPKDLTLPRAFYECVFPSLARHVDTNLRIVYQEDNEPGLIVRGDEDPSANNDIVYLEIDTAATQFVGVTELDIEKGMVSSIYPNPAANNAYLEYSVKVPGQYSIKVTSITGVVVKAIDLGNVGSGNYKQQLNIDNLTNGVYVVTLTSGDYASSQRIVVQK